MLASTDSQHDLGALSEPGFRGRGRVMYRRSLGRQVCSAQKGNDVQLSKETHSKTPD